jgi:hypothetical protein
MANWLQKTSQTYLSKFKTINLPMVRPPQLPAAPGDYGPQPPASVPPASFIYGIAASALCVMSLYFIFTGHWVTGLLVLLPAAALLGFALHFLKR